MKVEIAMSGIGKLLSVSDDILQEGEPTFRSQLVLPAMTGFQTMLNLWRMNEAPAYSENMPEWPAEGCVHVQNSRVIVKLSDYE